MNITKYGAAIGCAKSSEKVNLSPLRFTNTGTESATVAFTDTYSEGTQLQYRTTADGEFTSWDFSALTIPVGDFVEIVGENSTLNPQSGIGQFTMTGDAVAASGNIMTLLYGADITKDESRVITMDSVFNQLFYECTSLTTAPELPATTLAGSCYILMFAGCTSLTTAPELPATTLADNCYYQMFTGCTSLTTAPELPATTLALGCYYQIFGNCTSLTTAPELPATTLALGCYAGMFYSCTSLTTAPELPATTLAESCYMVMFYGCTSLTTAPELSATTLAESCYTGMFYGCTSLTTAPELPATTLADKCYQDMFKGCTSLTTAPELPATTLVTSCYSSMFNGCTSLAYIKCLATDISATNSTSVWTSGVAASGTFVKAVGMNDWTTGQNGIPSGWTVETT